jgi:hypothetical protein
VRRPVRFVKDPFPDVAYYAMPSRTRETLRTPGGQPTI